MTYKPSLKGIRRAPRAFSEARSLASHACGGRSTWMSSRSSSVVGSAVRVLSVAAASGAADGVGVCGNEVVRAGRSVQLPDCHQSSPHPYIPPRYRSPGREGSRGHRVCVSSEVFNEVREGEFS